MKVIEALGITKNYGLLTAVNNVTLNINEGELYGLLGPNGSGKTTTVKLLTGQLKPDKGSINVLGINVIKDPVKAREGIGIIPEQETPPSFLTAEEYLTLITKIRAINNPESVINHWFKFLDFENEKNVLCKDLSRGTRQKLMFAQAFMHEPKLAFIDEPLINLDPLIQRKVKEFLKDYVKKGNSILFSTHVLEIAEEICTRFGILYQGRLIHESSIKELKKKTLEKLFIEQVEKLRK